MSVMLDRERRGPLASFSFLTSVAVVALVAFNCNTSLAQDVITCIDRDPDACKVEASRGDCYRNPTVVDRCRLSCQACDIFGCSNNISTVRCDQMISDCFNSSRSEFMAANCSQSCGLCAYNPLGSSDTPSPFASITSQDIFVTNETHILRIAGSNPNTTTTIVNQDGGNIVALAVDTEKNLIFWANNALHWRGIYRCNFNGSNVKRILSEDILEVNGMAADSVAGHIYWTDAQRRRIELTDYDGRNRKVIAYTDLVNPRGIVVDTVNGFLYWNDQGTQRIEQSQLDGRQRVPLVETNVSRPNQMVLGTWQNTSKLFWVDACDSRSNTSGDCIQSLKSFNLLDKSVVMEFNLSQVIGSKVVFGLAIQDHLVYVSVWKDCAILELNLESRTIRTVADHLGSEVLFSLALTEDSWSTSETQRNPCSQPNRGGCSNLCIPLGGAEFRCSCPTFGALVLAKDGKTCTVPSEFLLYCDAYYGHVGFIDVSSDPLTSDLHLIAYSSRPIGVAYDPVNQTVYWSDVKDRFIYQIPVSGAATKQKFLEATQGLGIVDGLNVDWRNRKLYFTNEDFVTVDGVAFSWHRIEVIGLDGKGRRAIVTDVELPRGLWVDSERGFLYYTDWGSDAKAVRANLDGSGSEVLLRGLENPNGVVALGAAVYVIDSSYKTKERGETPVPSIYRVSFAADGSKTVTRTNLTQLQTPFGIAANGTSTLFLSDWDNGTVISYDATTGRTDILLNNSGLGQPASLLFTPSSAALEEGVCSNANCSDVCLQSANASFSCSCPSDQANVLSENSMDCIEPENFLLIADMTSIAMIGLEDGDDRSLYRLVNGEFFSDMTAVAFDAPNKTLYYSDSNRGAIYRTVIGRGISGTTDTDTLEIYRPHHVIEDMALDSDRGYLYWTAYDKDLVARLKLSEVNATHEVLISNTSQPRAIALDGKNGYIYWTAVGSDPGLWRSTVEGSNMRRVTGGIDRPNGLYLDSGNQMIYVLDGVSRFLFQCSFKNSETMCQKIQVLPGVGPFFGLVFYDNLVYYSDWGSDSVYLFDPQLNVRKTVASNLMRPTRLLIHHPRNITENCVSSRVHCEELCSPIPGGYQCGCHSGETLASDGQTCITTRNIRLPPRFLYCPKNKVLVTRNTKVIVWWRDPVVSPVVQAGDQSAPMCSLSSGSEVGVGNTTVNCTVTNRDGLTAACIFNITVIQVGYSCEDPPSPVNGKLNCVEQPDGNYTCKVVCDDGYTALRVSDSLQHQCINGTWSPPFSTSSDNIVCLKIQDPSQQVILGIRFPGQCPRDDSQFESDFRTTLSLEFYRFGLCAPSELLDMCDPVNYGSNPLCPPIDGSRQAREAQSNSGSILVSILLWAPPSENQTAVGRIETLKKLVASGQLGVIFRNYSFTADQIDSVFPTVSCPTNWSKQPDGQCAECSDGSYYHVSNQSCSLCEAGTYQSLSSQDYCFPCPEGKTSKPGSFNLKQCNDISTTEPTPATNMNPEEDNNKRIALIVGLCVGLGGGLLLILAIVLLAVFLHRRRVRRKKDLTGSQGRAGNGKDIHGRSSGAKQSTYLAWPDDDGSHPVQLAMFTPIDSDLQPRVSSFRGSDSEPPTELRELSSGESVRVIPMPTRIRPSRASTGGGRGDRPQQMHQRVDLPRTPTSSIGVYKRNGSEHPVAATRSADPTDEPTLPIRFRSEGDLDETNSTGWKSLSSNEQTTV